MFLSYYNYLLHLNFRDLRTDCVFISPSTKTTKLMTRLRHRFHNGALDNHCEEPIDLLKLRFVNMKFKLLLDLAVVYDLPDEVVHSLKKQRDIWRSDNCMTFSELKRTNFALCILQRDAQANQRIDIGDGKVLRLWDKPFILRAVTEYDKDFRKEWMGGNLEYQGNQYGDTSNFYIIGTIETSTD